MNDDPQNDQNLVQNPQQDINLPIQQQPTSTPVSPPQKETQPYYGSSDKDDFVEVSEKEPQIRPEVESAGVYKVSDKIKLDREARDAGLSEAKESNPAFTTPTGNVKLPMDGVEAHARAKGNPQDSSTWLGKLVLFVLQKIGVGNA
jgi:hypothetical protein